MTDTTFNNDIHNALFFEGENVTNGNSFSEKWSDIIFSALKAGGMLDNIVISDTPPDRNSLWLDTRPHPDMPSVLRKSDPATLEWNKVTYSDFFDDAETTTRFTNVAALIATMRTFAEGVVLRTEEEGFAYVVAATDATDHDVTTAGGVKLYVQKSDDGNLNVLAFGAVADGTTDNLATFQQADLRARTVRGRTFIPGGVWAIDGEWQLNTNSHVVGEVGRTEIKQISSDMADNVITTVENTRTDNANTVENVHVFGITANGDYTRNAGPYSGIPASGGCGISFANVIGGSIKECHAVDCTKHGIDVTASVWNVTGDDPTTRPSGGCADIAIEDCSSTNHGDDGITTHYSRNLDIRNCRSNDSGDFYAGGGNSNGIEIDDGSYDVRIFGGRCERNTRGIQIKGHSYAPAASRVRVFGLTCENNTQNFVVLHDDFETGPVSISAYDIEFHGCVSIVPRQKGSSTLDRRSLNISEYGGVLVNGFTVAGINDPMPISDPTYVTDPSASSSIAVFGNARNVVLKGIRFNSVQEAGNLIQVNASASDVTITDVSFQECSGLPISIASGTEGVVIKNIRATTSFTPAPARIIDFNNSPDGMNYTIEDVRGSGYTNKAQLSSVDYPIDLNFEVKNQVVIAQNVGNPEGVVPATEGSICYDTGTTPRAYIKEGGGHSSTGWVEK